MNIFRSAKAAGEPPGDNPDLSYTMAFVTAIGGVSAYMTKKSSVGLLTGLSVGSLFAIGGYWITSGIPEKHQVAHQMSLIGSVLFAGAMGYRASANPYAGPGGNMLAALGVVSSAYHLSKMLEWQAYDQERLRAASQLLSQYGGSAPPGDSPTKLNRPVPPGGF